MMNGPQDWLLAGVVTVLAALLGVGVKYRTLLRRHEQTKTLLSVSLEINSTLVKTALLKKIMQTAARVMDAESSSIILLDQARDELYFEVATGDKENEVREIRLQKGEGIAGWVAETGQSVKLDDVQRDPRWSNRVAMKTDYPTRNLLCVPVVSSGKMLGVLQVLNKRGQKHFADHDLELLQMIALPVAIALENALLYEALQDSIQHLKETTAAKERLESELKIARDIQMSFLPDDWPDTPDDLIRLAAGLLPARQVGGDFYHYFYLDDDHLLFALGDVSDKGIPAALFMAVVMTLIRGKADASLTPGQLLESINQEICRKDSTMFATVFCGILNIRNGRFVYSDGGHCTPYVIHHGGEVSELSARKSLPLGAMADAPYYDQSTELAQGELLVLYTDGVSEAENSHRELFGTARLRGCLQAMAGKPADAVIRHIEVNVREFVQDAPQSDDIALLIIDRPKA